MSDNLLSMARGDPSEFILLAISLSLKETWGSTANVALYRSGKELGKSLGIRFEKTLSLEEAVKELERILGNAWKGRLEGDKLVFDKCILRDLYRRGGVELDEPLPTCYFHIGFCAGVLERILGRKVNLKAMSRGPLSCVEQIIME